MAKPLTLQTIFEAVDRLSGPTRTMAGNVDRSTRGMKKGFDGLGASSLKIGRFLKGAAVGLATGEVAKALGDFAEHGDEIARNAKITGLSTTAYQELAYAAKMADIPQEDLAAAMKKMNVNIGELRTQQGTLYETLKKTNPKLAFQLRDARSTDEAFNDLAQTLGKETNVQKRAALAVAAFGKAGQGLIPMFDDLERRRREAEQNGGILSEDQVRTAERLDESLKKIKTSLGGMKNTGLGMIADDLLPSLEDLSKWLKDNKDDVSSNIKPIFDALAGAVKTASSAASVIGDVWKAFTGIGDIVGGLVTGDMGMVKKGASAWSGDAIQKHGEGVVRGLGLGSFIDAPKSWNDKAALALGIRDKGAYVDMPFAHMPTAAADAMLAGMIGGYQSQSAAAVGSVSDRLRASKMPGATGEEVKVTVDFKNLPAGVTVRQSGQDPGVKVKTGSQMTGALGAK